MTDLPDILKTIVARKREEVAAARSAMPLAMLKRRVADLEEPPRGFVRALRASVESGWTGVIGADFDPIGIAEIYEKHGAACLSVLTDEEFFLGHLRFLGLIREQVRL